MNDNQNSSTGRLFAGAREVRAKDTPDELSRHFASYMRLFDDFVRLLICQSHWEVARFFAGCRGRFLMAQAHVAFL